MRILGNARDMGTPRSARRSAAVGEGTRVLAGRRTVSGPLENGRTLSISRRKPSPLNPAVRQLPGIRLLPDHQLRPSAACMAASSLIRFDVCGHDAPVGLSESFDVNLGANSERPVLLLKLGGFVYDHGFLRDHPDPQKSPGGQLLNDSFKMELRVFICRESRAGDSDSHNKGKRGHFHTEESSITRSLAA
jgi:hypothetical protein